MGAVAAGEEGIGGVGRRGGEGGRGKGREGVEGIYVGGERKRGGADRGNLGGRGQEEGRRMRYGEKTDGRTEGGVTCEAEVNLGVEGAGDVVFELGKPFASYVFSVDVGQEVTDTDATRPDRRIERAREGGVGVRSERR